MNIIFLRHGKTQSNLASRYCGGKTDEPLCPEGNAELSPLSFSPEMLYVSPMIRARQTAEICFPNVPSVIIENLRELDLGDWDGCNPDELLKKDDYYQKWIDGGGLGPIPNGDSIVNFAKRTTAGFEEIKHHSEEHSYGCIAIVAHGGTIMSLLYGLSTEKKSLYDYYSDNGHGYTAELMPDGLLHNVEKY